MKNRFFGVMLAVFSLYACDKDKNLSFSIHGVISDNSLNKGLDNATVIVYEKAVASLTFNEIGRTKTDASGNYTLKFPRNRVESYKVLIQKDFYFDKEETIAFSSLDPKKSIEYNYGTTAYSWVKVLLTNTNDVNDFDDFLYKVTKGRTGCQTCATNEEKHFYGALDTTFYYLTDGNKPFAYYFALSNTTTLGNNEQTTVPFDTIVMVTSY